MARPIAPRFEITVLKVKSSTDSAQVVATDASIEFYRQGATVESAITLASHATHIVDVFDAGQISFADTVRVESTTYELSVMDVPSQTQVELYNGNLVSVGLIAGTRLTPVNDRPQAFADPLATAPLGSTITPDPANGRASAYVANDRLDYEVVVPGQATRLYIDAAGVVGRSGQRWSDLRDFGGDLQAALDALPADGGVVFVPAGLWCLTSGVTVDKPNVTIMGEQGNSVLKASTPNAYDLITVLQPKFQMRDLQLDGAATGVPEAGGKSCLVFPGSSVASSGNAGSSLWNVSIVGAARYGLWLRDPDGFLASECYFIFNPGSGVRVERSGQVACGVRFISGAFSQNGTIGMKASGIDDLLVQGTGIEGNDIAATEDQGCGIDAQDCRRLVLRGCYFEDADNPTDVPTSQFIALRSCLSPTVDACWFQGGPDVAKRPLRAIKLISSTFGRMTNCTFSGITDHVLVVDASSTDGLEFGNVDFSPNATPFARFQILANRFVSMSNRFLSLPAHANTSTRPAAQTVLPGSMIWIDSPDPGDSKLQVSNGNSWLDVAFN